MGRGKRTNGARAAAIGAGRAGAAAGAANAVAAAPAPAVPVRPSPHAALPPAILALLRSAALLPPPVRVGDAPTRARFDPPTMGHAAFRPPHKPTGGLWTAPLDDPAESDGGVSTPWTRWADLVGTRCWRLHPDPAARVAVIARREDLLALLAHFPLAAGAYPFWAEVNYPALAAAGVDAVHLTASGQAACAFDPAASLYGWDVASTLWLRWIFVAPATDLGPAVSSGE